MRFLLVSAVFLFANAEEFQVENGDVNQLWWPRLCIFKDRCYTELLPLGCFDCYKGMLARLPEDIDPKFQIYTSTSPEIVDFNVKTMNATLKATHIPEDSTVLFVIHGFGSTRSDWVYEMKDLLLNISEKYVVITTDWQEGTDAPNYIQGALNSEVVGRTIGVAIHWIHQYHNVPYFNFRLIAFSLGAQVAGFAGRYLRERHHSSIGAIFALDPAGPLFRKDRPRITRADAGYVEVLHTSGSDVYWDGFSDMRLTGHVDFYANGGRHQPGCEIKHRTYGNAFWDLFGNNLVDKMACNHKSALDMFMRTIVPNPYENPYIAYRCASMSRWASAGCFNQKVRLVGYKHDIPELHSKARGTYYFGTPWNWKLGAGVYYKVMFENNLNERLGNVLISDRYVMDFPGGSKPVEMFFPMTSDRSINHTEYLPSGISFRTAIVSRDEVDLDGVVHHVSPHLTVTFVRVERPNPRYLVPEKKVSCLERFFVAIDNVRAAVSEAFARPKTAAVARVHPSPSATTPSPSDSENMAGSAEAAKNFLESAFNKTKEVVSTAAETTKGYANVAINKIIPGQGQPGVENAAGQPAAPGAPGTEVNAPGPQAPQ